MIKDILCKGLSNLEGNAVGVTSSKYGKFIDQAESAIKELLIEKIDEQRPRIYADHKDDCESCQLAREINREFDDLKQLIKDL